MASQCRSQTVLGSLGSLAEQMCINGTTWFRFLNTQESGKWQHWGLMIAYSPAVLYGGAFIKSLELDQIGEISISREGKDDILWLLSHSGRKGTIKLYTNYAIKYGLCYLLKKVKPIKPTIAQILRFLRYHTSPVLHVSWMHERKMRSKSWRLVDDRQLGVAAVW